MKHQRAEQNIPADVSDLPRSRAEALKLKVTKYFTGKPCKKGHVAVRYTHSGCSVCRNEICAESYRSKPENQKKARRESRKWYQQNKERQKEHSRRRRKNNMAAVLTECANRRAAKLQATPKWVDVRDLNNHLKKLYAQSLYLYEQTGIKHQIDHIIPLQGNIVCGLHCKENLRVITANENNRKKNKLDEDLI